MPNLTLTNPTDVSRSGSTLSWTNVGNVLNAPPSYATAGTFLPGVSADWIRLTIADPSLVSLPTYFDLTINGATTTSDLYGTQIWVDTVQLGNSGTPVSPALSPDSVFTSTDARYTFQIPTSGLTLTEVNAGTANVFLGISGAGRTFNAGNWTVSYTASGNLNVNGTLTPWTNTNSFSHTLMQSGISPSVVSESGEITCVMTWNAGGTPDPYVIMQIESQGAAGSSATFQNTGSTYTATCQDGFGNTDTQTHTFPVGSASASINTTEKFLVPVVGGVASYTVSNLLSYSSALSSGELTNSVSLSVTATPVAPDPMSVRVDDFALSYMAGSGTGPISGGPLGGSGSFAHIPVGTGVVGF